MPEKNGGCLRDPIWQFLGVVISVLALGFSIFIWFTPIHPDLSFTHNIFTGSPEISTTQGTPSLQPYSVQIELVSLLCVAIGTFVFLFFTKKIRRMPNYIRLFAGLILSCIGPFAGLSIAVFNSVLDLTHVIIIICSITILWTFLIRALVWFFFQRSQR